MELEARYGIKVTEEEATRIRRRRRRRFVLSGPLPEWTAAGG